MILGLAFEGQGQGQGSEFRLLLHCNLMEVGFRLDVKQLLGWTWQRTNINISGIPIYAYYSILSSSFGSTCSSSPSTVVRGQFTINGIACVL